LRLKLLSLLVDWNKNNSMCIKKTGLHMVRPLLWIGYTKLNRFLKVTNIKLLTARRRE